jgi:formylglycine-generating enzyme required for sulfatase activity
MKGTCSTQAVLAVCTALLFAACGGSGESGEAVEDASGSDLPRAFDVGQPDTLRVTGKDVSADTAHEIDLFAHDMADAADVCIPDCEDMECGDDGCGGSCGDCDDGDVCNGVESCEAGLCDAGTILDCDDDNPCTLDECHAQAGCQHTQLDGPCDDGNPCTDGETCTTGICNGGTKVVCDDHNPCTTDACSTVEGCIAIPNSAACNEGDPCTVGDQCVDGACQPGEDVCFPCQSDLDCLQYDDGNLCNGLVVCEGGLCEALADSAVECMQPDNPCLTVSCVADSGDCVETALPDMTYCDDENICTLDDVCKIGVCSGKPVNCEEGNKCTIDSCVAGVGCVHVAKECPHQPCHTAKCVVPSGECLYLPVDCFDGNPCTVDECDPALDGCIHSPVDCNDGNPCTDDLCEAGADGGPVCVHPPNDANMCDDAFVEAVNVCSGGTCICISQKCELVCGDGECWELEDCSSCPSDCGSCQQYCDEPCGEYEECIPTSTGEWVCAGTMLEIPASTFMMGCNAALDDICDEDEYPYHPVYLDTYRIDRTEVTNASYERCVQAGVCEVPDYECMAVVVCGDDWPSCLVWEIIEYAVPEHPVVCIDWYDAKTLCEWLGKRPPTEAEWEKAARGTDGQVYPWGNAEATCADAVMNDEGDGCGTEGTLPVCSKSPAGDSPYGLCDMAGNAREWVHDKYAADYYSYTPIANPQGPSSGWERVLRGGSWHSDCDNLRVSSRYGSNALGLFTGVGFRCASSE